MSQRLLIAERQCTFRQGEAMFLQSEQFMLAETLLKGMNVLVVENEWLIADDIKRELLHQGVHVLGPVSSVSDALTVIADADRIDAAVLDVHLSEEASVYVVAETLMNRNVPFVFATGYDHFHIRRDFIHVPHLMKPFAPAVIGPLLATLLNTQPRFASC